MMGHMTDSKRPTSGNANREMPMPPSNPMLKNAIARTENAARTYRLLNNLTSSMPARHPHEKGPSTRKGWQLCRYRVKMVVTLEKLRHPHRYALLTARIGGQCHEI